MQKGDQVTETEILDRQELKFPDTTTSQVAGDGFAVRNRASLKSTKNSRMACSVKSYQGNQLGCCRQHHHIAGLWAVVLHISLRWNLLGSFDFDAVNRRMNAFSFDCRSSMSEPR